VENFKFSHEKNEFSDHNDDEKGKKEFEESFEETKESTPRNNNEIVKSRSHGNLQAKEIKKNNDESLSSGRDNKEKPRVKGEVHLFIKKKNGYE